MTNHQTPQMRTEREELIDSIVSRRVDGEIDVSEVPVDLRKEVENRVTVVSHLRDSMRDTRSKVVVHETQITSALGAASTSRRLAVTSFATSRAGLGIAASFLALVTLSVLAVRQPGSRNDDPTDSMAMAVDEFSSRNESSAVVADESERLESTVVDDSNLQDEDVLTSSRPDEAITSLEFATDDDIAAFASSFDPSQMMTDPTLPDSSPPRCGEKSSRPRAIRRAMFRDRRVEIHVVERRGYIAYDLADCSIVSRNIVDSPPKPNG